MKWLILIAAVGGLLLGGMEAQAAEELPKLTEAQSARAAAHYQQYCALCHGENREGYANDEAPSLRSQSLLEAGFYQRVMATSYGRPGTAMQSFLDVGLREQDFNDLVSYVRSFEIAGDSAAPRAVLGPTESSPASTGFRPFQSVCAAFSDSTRW